MKPTKLICPECNKKYEIYTVFEILDFRCSECVQRNIDRQREEIKKRNEK